MNLDNLQRKLLAAARAQQPNQHVPYAFEQRIMHRIKSIGAIDGWTAWAQALWRAAAPCVGVALLLVAWSMLSGQSNSYNSNLDISQQFENTVLAAATVDQPVDPTR